MRRAGPRPSHNQKGRPPPPPVATVAARSHSRSSSADGHHRPFSQTPLQPWLDLAKPLEHPVLTLAVFFAVWKILLLFVAACSPGLGYDTSTMLFLRHAENDSSGYRASLLRRVAERLIRWDAIYFSQISGRGYLFEQEWAFGWGFTRLVAYLARYFKGLGLQDDDLLDSLVGIGISHVSHGLSVLALYYLGCHIINVAGGKRISFIAACLHVISPAGLFLSAPYGESTFALLAFLGYLLFAQSFPVGGQSALWQDVLVVASGLLFGLATTIRSNGLLNGFLFLEEVLRTGRIFLTRGPSRSGHVRRLAVAALGGICTAMGFLLPQYIAYQEYCGQHSVQDGQSQRPWCQRMLPSVYAFVQDHYWNVGFLRYWTLSNIPLFLLASPMLAILIVSSHWAMKHGCTNRISDKSRLTNPEAHSHFSNKLLRSLAVPQFVLAVLALTSYHVQIITRISSGYCIWYFWLSSFINASSGPSREQKSFGSSRLFMKLLDPINVVKYMVMYALVQGGLYASFLPPA